MSNVSDLAIMVEQQIAFIKRDLSRIPMLPVPVVHGFVSVEAGPLMALSATLQAMGFQVSEPDQRACIDEIGVHHSFHGLYATQKNRVDFDLLHLAAEAVRQVAADFNVTYDNFFVDVSALSSDA
jgi:hypothetical protein